MVTFRMLQQPFRQGTWHLVHTGMFVVHTGMFVVHTGMFVVHTGMFVVHTGMFVVHTGMFVMHTGVKIAQIALIASFELPPCLFFLVTACIA